MLLSVPVSNAAKLVMATEQRCCLFSSVEHSPVKSAVPPCRPDACSVSSPLIQKASGVDEKSVSEVLSPEIEPPSSVPPPESDPSSMYLPSTEALVSTSIPFFALYGGRFSSQTLPTPLMTPSQNSGAAASGGSRKSA